MQDNPSPTRVLVVDDDPSTCTLLEDSLTRKGFSVATRTDASEAIELLRQEDFHVVLSDLHMEGTNGVELCKQVCENRPDIPVIIITGFGSMEAVVEAIRAGAYDFVNKPCDVETLRITIERADAHRKLRAEVKRLRSEVRSAYSYEGMLGRSRSMRGVYDLISRAGPSEATVLITGESGTGKELVARALHAESKHAGGPFVAVNCAAMPETLLESELFGHTRGAFTDAKTGRDGLFVVANGGTLFLDEIGDMPLSMQVKLLRALQERRVRPIGGSEEVPFNVRLVAATNRDIDTDVEEGKFRADLFYRLNVVRIPVPPLRARGNDILLLAHHFLARSAEATRREVTGISREAAEKMIAYPFSGNVRELENTIERAVALTTSHEIQVEDLPAQIRTYERAPRLMEVESSKDLISMDEVERRYVQQVLSAVAGNKTQAAHVLKMDRKTLYRKLQRWQAATGAPSAQASAP